MNLNNTPRTEIRRNVWRLLCLAALADKLSLLEHFNGRTFNTVPAGTAANDDIWRIAA